MTKSLKDTIAQLKTTRSSKRDQAAKLRAQAKELDDQCYGLTEAIDALEPWERASDPERPAGGTGIDPEGVGQYRG